MSLSYQKIDQRSKLRHRNTCNRTTSLNLDEATTKTPQLTSPSQNGGTTGGAGGKVVTVTTYADLAAAVQDETAPVTVYIKGQITGTEKIRVGSNKSILGLDSTSAITGFGLFLRASNNVIIRNLAISKVRTGSAGGDAIGVQESRNVWIDHCDLSSDLSSGKDYYDGLADFSHGSDWLTVSNTLFHDHFKA